MKIRRGAVVLLGFALPISLAVGVARNWVARHPEPPVDPKINMIEKSHILVTPGHVKIYNGTDKVMGFMVFPKNGLVICPRFPINFGVTCIDVPAKGSADYIVIQTER